MKPYLHKTVLLLAPILLGACSLQKNIPQGKVLLHKNTIRNAPGNHKDQLEELIIQQPNRKIFGAFPFYLHMYYLLESDKKNFKKKLQNTLGEKPVYLDSNSVITSTRQIRQYLLNKGYINANVNQSIKIRNKKARVTYYVNAKIFYVIQDIEYHIHDRFLDSLIRESNDKSLLGKGQIYDSERLINEMKRITTYLRKRGFYKFSRDYIYADVDTSVGNHKIKIGIGVRNYDTYQRHRRYKIRKILLEPTYRMIDTLSKDTQKFRGYYVVQDQQYINPSTLTNQIALREEQWYNQNDVEKTINQLNGLDIFKFIDVNFSGEKKTGSNTSWINCYIRMTPQEKRELQLELELTTTEQDEQFATLSTYRFYGLAPNIIYSARNLFSRALHWQIKLGGAYELSNNWITTGEGQNLYEFGVNTALIYPKTFLPQLLFGPSLAQTSKTAFNLSYLIEGDPRYLRSTGSFRYAYQFNNELNQHFITPIDINRIQTENITPAFQQRLEELQENNPNPFLKSIFETYIISGSHYNFIYNDQPLKGKKHWLIRFNVLETAGNTLWFYKTLTGEKPSDEGTFQYTFGDIGFYQYVKSDIDVRYYLPVDENELALRINTGIGIPYGNTRDLPFERSFYAGGSNSIRAWAVRELGPGTYQPPATDLGLFYQVGDIKMEGNIEYRFPLGYIFEAAIFSDFGNIWNLRQEEDFEGGTFEKDFLSEIAIGSGLGLRLNFTYFIFRLDFAWQLRDPANPKGDRWETTLLKDGLTLPRLNIGVGYPF